MKTHGLGKHPLNAIWDSMRGRCNCVGATSYKHYGGKGIKVCGEWDDFMNFYNWALANGWEDGLSLERKENDKDYCPDNCLFITKDRQKANRSTVLYFEYNGERMILADWCRKFNMEYPRIQRRLEIGWSFERAITTPVKTHRDNKKYNTQTKKQ